jgi:lipopolysaccharide biosynthesis regulator YciM
MEHVPPGDAEALARLMQLGEDVWNSVVHEANGEPEDLAELRRQLRRKPDLALAERLIARKRNRFREYTWVIEDSAANRDANGERRGRPSTGEAGAADADESR